MPLAPLRTWIDERSFDELTEAAVPTGKYQYIVEMIQREPGIFRGEHTLLDAEVNKLKEELEFLAKRKKDIVKQVDESDERRDKLEHELIKFRDFFERQPKRNDLQTQEEVSQFNARERKLAMLEKSFATTDRNHKLLLLEQLDVDDRFELVKKLHPILEEVQKWTVKRFISLHRAGQEYKLTRDVEKLKKSVHWIGEYGDAMIDRAARQMPDYMSKILTKSPTRVESWLSSEAEEQASATTEDF
jgi:hypothetical protein